MRRYRGIRFANTIDRSVFMHDSAYVYEQLRKLREAIMRLAKYGRYFNVKANENEYGNLLDDLQTAILKAENNADLFQGRAIRIMNKDGLLK